jgi:hypothetical protein
VRWVSSFVKFGLSFESVWKENIKLMKVATFAEIADEFLERVNRIVWCNFATIDTKGRPRSRILHPLWEGEVGWITTRRGSPKARHLQEHPQFGLLKLTPWRIEVSSVATIPPERKIWYAS